MFKATKPFKNTITGYNNEPSLRIGKRVPENAVNLAYYYNPLSTKAERILASDPPRLTIDHRVETQWLTKTDQAAGPNGEEPSIDLFPKSVYYSDEEGYYGKLARQDETVKWYPEYHVNQKPIEYDTQQIVEKKGDEDKVIAYSDADGFKGNLYLDTSSYEVLTTVDVSTTEQLDYTINDFELNYYDIFGVYLDSDDMNNGPFMNEPNPMAGEDYCWPSRIELTHTKLLCSDVGLVTTNTNNKIANYINKLNNDFEGANEYKVDGTDVYESSKPIGYLYFDKLEYEPVKYNINPKDGNISKEKKTPVIKTDNFNWQVTADMESYTNKVPDTSQWEKYVKVQGQTPKKTYLAEMGQNYEEITDFMIMLESSGGSYQVLLKVLQDAIDEGKDIAIWLCDMSFVVNDESIDMLVDGSHVPGSEENEIDAVADPSACHFEIAYKYIISDRGSEGTILYNITANYHSITLNDGTCSVKRTIKTKKKEAGSYRAYCHYSGLVDKNWIDYDGIAFYMGPVTKGNAIGNQNAEENDEILMFPDENGYLRQIIEGIKETTDKNNRTTYSVEYRDYYALESETVYVTDVFRDNKACFYKYILKHPIYDYRGPDEYGFYKGDAVQIYTSTLKDVPNDYKHNIKLVPAKYEDVKTYDQNNQPLTVSIPKYYYAELFTSFISSSTDTFKVIYNGFNDIDDDNKVLDNGIEEDIYNYPYMVNGVDFKVVTVNKKMRLNYIYIPNYTPIKDERLRVTFTWRVIAIDKEHNTKFTSETRQASILNKDYCLPCEHSNFEGRGYIISPKLNGDSIPASPRDLCLHDQAGYQSKDNNYVPVIDDQNYNFIYYVEIVNINKDGSVNLKCNPDGSGVITAETTLDTGFYSQSRASYTRKLDMENPYWTDGKYIYKGYMVKCIDTRNIKVKAPREEKLLDSWYPMIQFGHFSRVMDQYGVSSKVCYTMPEYDTQHYSDEHGKPYIDIENEKLTVLNPHMVQTMCYPLYNLFPNVDKNTYYYNGKYYKVFIDDSISWLAAEAKCRKIGGHLVMPKNNDEMAFIKSIANKYNVYSLWIGGVKPASRSTFNWVDGSVITWTNYKKDQPGISAVTSSDYHLVMYGSGTANGSLGEWACYETTSSMYVKGYICEFTGTIEVFKKVDNELFRLNIENISYTDGIIILKESISENDYIIANYTYMEENYNYRGYWRDQDDFVRIDLNPNMYHTYNNPTFLPSEVSPSKNLFNKVIYFFLRPTGIYNIESDQSSLYYSTDRFKKVPYQSNEKTFTIKRIKDISTVNSVYASEKEIMVFVPLSNYTGSFSVTMNTGHWFGFSISEAMNENSDSFTEIANTGYEGYATHSNTTPLTITLPSITLRANRKYSIKTRECSGGGTEAGNFVYTFNVDSDFSVKYEQMQVVTKYNIEPSEIIHEIVSENDDCLYHKIDDPEPDAEEDILVGSIYIRQNTSLHSTIITDSRTRGGGILEGISESLRHELEPESDFYLDIGYYDGRPYQENGVIVIRLDNKLLKENGGRFTIGDVETKVKRWLGAGIYPIIEFVDSYSKKDMPQYSLEISDSYANVIDITPEILLECVEV